ncbi:hypothetical protein ACFLZ1_01260 [Patescibacteria group bacterium]
MKAIIITRVLTEEQKEAGISLTAQKSRQEKKKVKLLKQVKTTN